MKNRLVIIGAGGHGKVIADIAKKNGYEDIVFLDDNDDVKMCGSYPVVGKSSEALHMNDDMVVAIGSADIRRKVQESLKGKNIVTLVHPNAVIADDAVIGSGTVVMAGAVVNSGTVIGKGCIINTCASVDHDCIIEDYVHVSVGSHVCGTVKVGKNTWIGAGAVIINNVSVCGDCMIGAGAVVIGDLAELGTYVGVPAVKVKYS